MKSTKNRENTTAFVMCFTTSRVQTMKSIFLLLVVLQERFEPIRSAAFTINHLGGGGGAYSFCQNHFPVRRMERKNNIKNLSQQPNQFVAVSNHILKSSSSKDNNEEIGIDYLKRELTQYLEKRKELNADELAKLEIGKVVGGTKGNKILDYISGSPNKEQITITPPNPLDYDELTKYGYGNLITPIMKNGGRLKMYELLGLEVPPIQTTISKPKSAPKLIIDREGKDDQARYSGLKLGQVYDDTIQGAVLEKVQQKIKAGENIRPKLIEEMYEIPFADKRNVRPAGYTPDWTVEKLDEWGKQQGKAQSWARKIREGEIIQDPNETLYIQQLDQRIYSVLTTLFITMSFGSSSYDFFVTITKVCTTEQFNNLLNVVRIPAIVLCMGSIGSSILCAIQAPEKNRNQFMWLWKGLFGGPFTVQYLQSLSSLITQGELKKNEDSNKKMNKEK